jgi:hypothetical protein
MAEIGDSRKQTHPCLLSCLSEISININVYFIYNASKLRLFEMVGLGMNLKKCPLTRVASQKFQTHNLKPRPKPNRFNYVFEILGMCAKGNPWRTCKLIAFECRKRTTSHFLKGLGLGMDLKK